MKGAGAAAAGRTVVAGALALLAACSVRYGSQALGQYELHEPFADLTRGARTVELSRAGHIAVIDIDPANPAFRQPPEFRTFSALYPVTVRDSSYYSAGTHRLRHTITSEGNRFRCQDGEIPSIEGCREAVGTPIQRIAGTVRPSSHYVLLVADEFVDPYTAAFYLNEAVVLSERLASALHQRNVQVAAEEITRAIADMPGLTAWSGYYVVRQN